MQASETRDAETHQIALTGRLVPGLVLGALVLQLVAPFYAWTMIAVALGGACVIGWLWARSLARGLHVERALRYGWTQVGDRIEERFTVEQRGLLPALWLEVRDESDLPGYEVSRATGLGSQATVQWVTEGICTRRGLYRLGPTTVRSGDPLGLFEVTIHHRATETLVVMPPVAPLASIAVAPGGRAGEGRRTRDSADRTVSAARVREFRSGDDARWIHWPTSARRDELYVRIFDSTPAGDWWLLLDAAAAAQAGEGAESTLEYGVILAASLADRGLREGRSVGLIADGTPPAYLPPRGGDGRRWDIMRSLSALSPGSVTIADALERLRPMLRQSASLIIISPDEPALWVPALLPLMRRGTVPTAIVIERESFGGASYAADSTAWLGALGIHSHVIRRGMLDQQALGMGHAGRWAWRVTGTGKAIAVQAPSDTGWTPLRARP